MVIMPLKGYIEEDVEVRHANPHAKRIGQLSVRIPGVAYSEFPVPLGCAYLRPYEQGGLEILSLAGNNYGNCLIEMYDSVDGELIIPSKIAKEKEFPFKNRDKLVLTVDYDSKRLLLRRKKE